VAVSRFVRPGSNGDAWLDERLEYSFSLACLMDKSEIVLEASEYSGGHLDWYSFDVDTTAASHGLTEGRTVKSRLNLLPVPIAYSGMPASRWWEFEDGAVYFGGIDASPADLARLLILEFATICSDDWFALPVRAASGSVNQVRNLEVLDVMGESYAIKPAAVLDHNSLKDDESRAWAFFELAGDPSIEKGQAPLLFVPPSLAGSLHSDPVESVTFVRDEAANLAWAIEEMVETATGKPLRRRLQSALALQAAVDGAVAANSAGPGATNGTWRWRLQTSVPGYWIPLIPERVDATSAQIMLRRGSLLAWDEMAPEAAGPRGRILVAEQILRLHEEEIAESGISVTRAWQSARGLGGSLFVWMSRRKRPVRGERGSGLKFDPLER
jgi:hypothetical protein